MCLRLCCFLSRTRSFVKHTKLHIILNAFIFNWELSLQNLFSSKCSKYQDLECQNYHPNKKFLLNRVIHTFKTSFLYLNFF